MNTVLVMRIAIVAIGLSLMVFSFLLHAKKKMNSDLATVWCIVGLSVLLVGAVPMFSQWLNLISMWTGVALLCVGTACLIGAFRICVMLSKLTTENCELAMAVSLLLSERQQGEALPSTEAKAGAEHEEAAVCH